MDKFIIGSQEQRETIRETKSTEKEIERTTITPEEAESDIIKNILLRLERLEKASWKT